MLALPHALVGLALFAQLVICGPIRATEAFGIDAFTTRERPLVRADHERLQTAKVTIYVVDGIDRFESRLSEGLSTDHESAKDEALQRLQQLDDAGMAPVKNAAMGLAKAVQYGIDRYPAIVFDERAVVYGVTDLVGALHSYEAWHREHAK